MTHPDLDRLEQEIREATVEFNSEPDDAARREILFNRILALRREIERLKNPVTHEI